jgi:hypothetical protein
MARKPTLLREWRISIIREKIQYLGRVVAPDKEAAIAKAMEEFRIEPVRRFRPIRSSDGSGLSPLRVAERNARQAPTLWAHLDDEPEFQKRSTSPDDVGVRVTNG